MRLQVANSIKTARNNVAAVFGGSLKGAAALADGVGQRKPRQRPALTPNSSKRLFHVLKAPAAAKAKLLTELFKDIKARLGTVVVKHNMKALAKHFGFKNDPAFIDHLRARVAAMELRDGSFSEFHGGALGRQNAFMGILFEFTVKYGPMRKLIESLSAGAVSTTNNDIARAAKTGVSHVMHDATGKNINVDKRFSKALIANAFDIDTVDGVKESLDFGPVSFNKDGQWFIPMPVEIKLPRAAGGVAGQFVQFPERLAAAMKAGKAVFAYFDADDLEDLNKHVGKGAILGQETIDGRAMVKVKLDPAKLVFRSDEIHGPMSRNQLVTQPDIDVWNPANPTAIPVLVPGEKVVIGKAGGQPISLDVAASAKGGGLNFWRMLVPTKRELFIDLYTAIFNVNP